MANILSVYKMSFPQVYPFYIKNGSKRSDLDEVKEIEDPTVQKFRFLDKLIDELAKGKPMDKILRS